MSEDRSNSSILGLTLQLQKYGVGNVGHNGDVSMMVLGHYDGLQIRKIQKWLDYSPRKDWEDVSYEIDSDLGEIPMTHYPIKLIFPVLSQSKKFPPLFYDQWKCYDSLLENNPCMTIVLINLTDTYRQQPMPQLLSSFLERLNTQCNVELLKKTHCCVMPTLGYSDFCILMADDNWKDALDLVDFLHRLTADDGKAVLSTDYMIPVLSNPKYEIIEKNFEGSALTVRIHLHPGVTAHQLGLPKDVLAFRPSGGSDCLLQAEDPVSQIKLLKFLLNPSSQNIIIDMTSLLRRPLGMGIGTRNDLSLTPTSNASEDSANFAKAFRQSIRTYGKALTIKRRHLRQVNALMELSYNIESICSQPHTGNLRKILSELIEDFSDSLNRCAVGMDTPDWPFDEMEQSVSTLSDIIGSFIADISRSDCFFIERERYNHQSVSSATSLLIAYNTWINNFSDAVRTATGQSDEENHSFLVTSGGQDRTQTFHSFEFLDPDEKDGKLCEKVPLITLMSEMSLFDFSGTIFRSVHECMHYCGIRLREARLLHLTNFISASLAHSIAEALFTPKAELEYARDIFQALGTANQVETPEKETERLYNESLLNLQERIEQCLVEYLSLDSESFANKKDYLMRNVQEWIYDNILQALSGYILRPNPDGTKELAPNFFASQLCIAVQDSLIGFRDGCDNLLKQLHIDTSAFAFESNKHRTYAQSGINDPVTSTMVHLILSRLLITHPPLSLPEDESGYAYHRLEKSIPYVALSRRNLNYQLQISVDIFSETFADVMACKVLDAKIEDYLLMHVYEDWDPDYSLEQEMANEYRIPAVLRLCFPASLDSTQCQLTSDCKDIIEGAIMRLERHGMPKNRLNAREIYTRVEKLLQTFKEKELIARHLLQYLQACLDKYTSLDVWNKLQEYARCFEEIRLLSIDPDDNNVNEYLVKMYYSLINQSGVSNSD